MYDIITKLTIEETKNYDSVMQKIVDSNELLGGKHALGGAAPPALPL